MAIHGGMDRQNNAMERYFMIMLLALVSLSCTREDTGADIDTSGYTLFEVSMDDLLLDTASPYQLPWKEGDRIGVYGSESGDNAGFWLKESGEGKTVAEFYGPVVRGELITAYYPWSSTYEAEVDRMPVDLAHVQTYSTEVSPVSQFLLYADMAFARMDVDGMLAFCYPFGILRVTVALDEPVYMTGACLESYTGIAGRMEVSPDGMAVPTDVSSRTITLDFSGNVVESADGNGNASLLFVLPAARYAAGSLSVSLSLTGGEKIQVSLGEVDVPKVSASDFMVEDVVVATSGIPALDVEDGYFE